MCLGQPAGQAFRHGLYVLYAPAGAVVACQARECVCVCMCVNCVCVMREAMREGGSGIAGLFLAYSSLVRMTDDGRRHVHALTSVVQGFQVWDVFAGYIGRFGEALVCLSVCLCVVHAGRNCPSISRWLRLQPSIGLSFQGPYKCMCVVLDRLDRCVLLQLCHWACGLHNAGC